MRASAPTEALQEVRWEEPPSHGFAVPAPFRQGGHGDGGRIATGAVRPRNDTLQVVRGAGVREGRPYGGLQGVRGAGDRKGRPYGGACVYIIYLYNKAVFFCDVKKIFCRRGKSAAKEGDFQMGSGGVRTGKVSPLWPLPVQGGRGIRALFYADRLRCFLLFAPNRYRAAG